MAKVKFKSEKEKKSNPNCIQVFTQKFNDWYKKIKETPEERHNREQHELAREHEAELEQIRVHCMRQRRISSVRPRCDSIIEHPEIEDVAYATGQEPDLKNSQNLNNLTTTQVAKLQRRMSKGVNLTDVDNVLNITQNMRARAGSITKPSMETNTLNHLLQMQSGRISVSARNSNYSNINSSNSQNSESTTHSGYKHPDITPVGCRISETSEFSRGRDSYTQPNSGSNRNSTSILQRYSQMQKTLNNPQNSQNQNRLTATQINNRRLSIVSLDCLPGISHTINGDKGGVSAPNSQNLLPVTAATSQASSRITLNNIQNGDIPPNFDRSRRRSSTATLQKFNEQQARLSVNGGRNSTDSPPTPSPKAYDHSNSNNGSMTPEDEVDSILRQSMAINLLDDDSSDEDSGIKMMDQREQMQRAQYQHNGRRESTSSVILKHLTQKQAAATKSRFSKNSKNVNSRYYT